MFRQGLRNLVFFVTLPLLLLASAGISLAHDTGNPHTHDSADESEVTSVEIGAPGMDLDALHSAIRDGKHSRGMPAIILIVPVGGDSSALHWLLHHISGQGYHDLSDWNHQHMHWHGVPHAHDTGIGVQGGDLSLPLTLYD